jgi:hypothetical protein
MMNVYVILDHRQQAEMQWLQDPEQSNVVNQNSVRCEASKHFMNKKKEYLKAKVDDLKLTVRPKIIRELLRVSVTLRRVTSLELI